MLDPLYLRYEEELGFIRNEVRHFATRYPLAASRLLLENDGSADPHVERLIEAFALLSARIRTKLDDEFPELVQSLVYHLYPHFTRPVPSMCTVGFEIDPKRARTAAGIAIPTGTLLETVAPDGDRITFTTGQATRIWPIHTVSARYLTLPVPAEWGLYHLTAMESALHLRLNLYGGLKWHELEGLKTLRFYIRGSQESSEVLIDTIMMKSMGCQWVSPASQPREILRVTPQTPIKMAGFEPQQAILPKYEPDLWPYRLMSEYMVFPEKFHYLDVPFPSPEELKSLRLENHLDLVIPLSGHADILQKTVSADTFTLGCTPAINLFNRTAEPIRTESSKYSYQVVADVAHPYTREIYSVNSVTWSSIDEGVSYELEPFLESAWDFEESQSARGFWHATRAFPLRAENQLSEIHLALVTPGFEPSTTEPATLVIRTLCSNGDLPLQAARVQGVLRFSMTGSNQPMARIVNLDRMTPSLRVPGSRELYSMLLSHLKLNHLSLADGDEAIESLRAILRLYVPVDSAISSEARKILHSRINALESIRTGHFLHRAIENGQSFWIRGLEINLMVNSEAFQHEGGLILWASLIERFLSLHLSINSLMKLRLIDTRNKGLLYEFPVQTGEVPAL
jgi:type VI secretion system protein ImpG